MLLLGMKGSRGKSEEFGEGSLRGRARIHQRCASEGRSLRIRQSISYRIKLRGIKLKEMPLNLRAHCRVRLAVFLCSGGGDTHFASGSGVEILIREVGSENDNFQELSGSNKALLDTLLLSNSSSHALSLDCPSLPQSDLFLLRGGVMPFLYYTVQCLLIKDSFVQLIIFVSP